MPGFGTKYSAGPRRPPGAELPLLVRGAYYDQFEPAKQPTDWDLDRFTEEVAEGLCR
jgi:uncharacterized protein (DUF2267 family)